MVGGHDFVRGRDNRASKAGGWCKGGEAQDAGRQQFQMVLSPAS